MDKKSLTSVEEDLLREVYDYVKAASIVDGLPKGVGYKKI